MRHLAIRFFSGLFQSLFVTLVLSLIVYSVLTGEFPPDWNHVKGRINAFRELANPTVGTVLVPTSPRTNEENTVVEGVEKDLAELETIAAARAAAGRAFLTGQGESAKGESEAKKEPTLLPAPVTSSAMDDHERVSELQSQLFRLQNRVSELERIVKSLGQHR